MCIKDRHEAFREMFGETANQACSENSPGRFRFDFPATGSIPASVLNDVEARVNTLLLDNLEVTAESMSPVSYNHLRAHETKANLVCSLLLEKKNAYQQLSHTLLHLYLLFLISSSILHISSLLFFFLILLQPPKSTPFYSSTASNIYKRHLSATAMGQNAQRFLSTPTGKHASPRSVSPLLPWPWLKSSKRKPRRS